MGVKESKNVADLMKGWFQWRRGVTFPKREEGTEDGRCGNMHSIQFKCGVGERRTVDSIAMCDHTIDSSAPQHCGGGTTSKVNKCKKKMLPRPGIEPMIPATKVLVTQR